VRQIVLDTETTGIDVVGGHRIIEIGCVELHDRRMTGREFHRFVNPEREIDADAYRVHGISGEFLADKPRFADIASDLLDFVADSELIIHNAPFDLGFLNAEWARLGETRLLEDRLSVLDTLKLAKTLNPGLRNSLDALCKRYGVDNSKRELHDARTDARLLAQVYLNMTGGQSALHFQTVPREKGPLTTRLQFDRARLPGFIAPETDLDAHRQRLAQIEKASKGQCIWLKSERPGESVQ
jgi:DNA polymerase III subunit epsilon